MDRETMHKACALSNKIESIKDSIYTMESVGESEVVFISPGKMKTIRLDHDEKRWILRMLIAKRRDVLGELEKEFEDL